MIAEQINLWSLQDIKKLDYLMLHAELHPSKSIDFHDGEHKVKALVACRLCVKI